MSLSGVVDTVLDRSVVLGFSQIGLSVRSRLPGWPADPPPSALLGRDVAVTGATSGLGISTALGVAALGARVHLVVRDETKAKTVVARITAATPSASSRCTGATSATWTTYAASPEPSARTATSSTCSSTTPA